MQLTEQTEVMDTLLELYDFHVRRATLNADDYTYGTADALGQTILDVGKLFGENSLMRNYKFEAYKRVMQYDTTANYAKRYPEPFKKAASWNK